MLFYLYRLSKDPSNYRHLEKMRRPLSRAGRIAEAVQRLQSDPNAQVILKAKRLYDENSISLDRLLTFPPATFGYRLAQFLTAARLDVVFFSRNERHQTEEETFYIRRVLQTHDMWHVLLNYSSSELDEIALQAFMLRQIHWPTAPYIIAGYLLRTLFLNPAIFTRAIAAIAQGWIHAGRNPSLFLMPLESYLTEDLEVVRARFQILAR